MRPSRFRVRQTVIPLPAQVRLIGGICVITDLQAIANHGCLYHGPTRFDVAGLLNRIFMLGGAPEAHESYRKRLGATSRSAPKVGPETFPIKASDKPSDHVSIMS